MEISNESAKISKVLCYKQIQFFYISTFTSTGVSRTENVDKTSR